jgi:hypothetical protein
MAAAPKPQLGTWTNAHEEKLTSAQALLITWGHNPLAFVNTSILVSSHYSSTRSTFVEVLDSQKRQCEDDLAVVKKSRLVNGHKER